MGKRPIAGIHPWRAVVESSYTPGAYPMERLECGHVIWTRSKQAAKRRRCMSCPPLPSDGGSAVGEGR